MRLHPLIQPNIQVLTMILSIPSRRSTATSAPSTPSLFSRLPPLPNRFPRNSEALYAGWHSAVTCHLQQDLANLLLAGAVGHGALDVGRQLRRAILAAQHGDIEKAARLEL